MVRKLICSLVFIFMVSVSSAFGAIWYVDNAASGTNAGTSWTNAWESFADISWGSISPEDTIYISGGSSSKIYNETLAVGASGTDGNNIVIQTGQTAGHNGTVIIDCQDVRYNGITLQDYVTISGEVSGNIRMRVEDSNPGTGIFSGDADGNVITYVEVDDCGGPGADGGFAHAIRLGGANGCEVSYCLLHDGYQDGFNSGGSGSNDHNNSFHHNTVYNFPDDGIQCSGGYDIYNNVIHDLYQRAGGGSGHPDGVQSQGSYIRVYNNEIYNVGTHAIFIDPCCGITNAQYYWVYNNVVYQTQAGYANGLLGQGIKVKQEDPGVTNVNHVYVANNTVVDLPRNSISLECQYHGVYGGDIIFENNLCYNDSTDSAYRYVMGTEDFDGDAGTWDYNLINAGPSGGTNMWWQAATYTYAQFVSNGYGQSHGQTGAPAFVSYTEFSGSNDLRLSATDTAATGNGINLSAYFTTDKDGNIRSAWNIGAYETAGADTYAPSISNPVPSTEQLCTTDPRSVTIGVTATDATGPITCHYDISDIAYASMSGVLETVSGTSHSHVVTDLACDASYTYYVRCSDSLANINSSSTTISFDIAEYAVPPECTGDDEFTGSNDDPPAASRWINSGSDIQSNSLRVGHTDAGGLDTVRSSWTTSEDITVDIDFDASSNPETEAWECILGLVIDSTHQVVVGIKYSWNGWEFTRGEINGSGWTWNDTSVTNNYGSLRLVKAGNSYSFYYRDGTGAWTLFGSAATVGSTSDEVYAYLGTDRWTDEPDTTSYFDNFRFQSGCIVDRPIILTTSPSTEQECTSDPRDVDLTVTTNEICECKKCIDGVGDCDADSTFNDAEMVAFSTTDAKTHEDTDSCNCDTTYKYRIICEDVGDVEMAANEDFSFFVAASGGDTTPPVMSNPLPSGVQSCSSNPRNVTISIVTNEAGTCKFSLDGDGGDDEDTTYDNLNNTFSTTGGTTHSQMLSLACDASYQYWVRCQDDEGTPNQNTASEEISFSLDEETAGGFSAVKGLKITGTSIK